MKGVAYLVTALLAACAGMYWWAYTGRYDVGADEPHWAVTSDALEFVRERSVEVRAANVDVPDLEDPRLVSLGAEHYSAMCAGCHRAPGVAESPIRRGLNPPPPDLTRGSPPPAEAFWVITHGIRMTGMPAWGATHDEQEVWAIVAFLQKLPDLDPGSYAALKQRTHHSEDHE